MSSLSPLPSDAEEREARRRATWGLGILALVAVLLVSIMVFFVGTSGGNDQGSGDNVGQNAPTEPTTTQRSTRATHPAVRTRTTHSRPPTSTSAHPKPISTANPCPSTAPCTVTGDAGQAVQALNEFRVKHGQPAVSGSVSAGARQCALHEGDGSTCVPHYSWQPVPNMDGAKAISAVAGTGAGTTWLLDPAMKSFSIGWAYSPGGKHFEFAVLKVT